MEFKKSKTYENLQSALEGELKASTKYKIYGMKARDDGFEQIGNIYDETSRNEREHAEFWLKLLNDGEIPYTLKNLTDSYSGVSHEWTNIYQDYAQVAINEGYNDIASLFTSVSNIERFHDHQFRELARNLETEEVFCKRVVTLWICLNCGNIVQGRCAPTTCPVCGSPQAYFELFEENY